MIDKSKKHMIELDEQDIEVLVYGLKTNIEREKKLMQELGKNHPQYGYIKSWLSVSRGLRDKLGAIIDVKFNSKTDEER